MANTTIYPYWKILAWRFLRSGIAGGASTVTAVGILLKPDFSNWKIYVAAIAAGFIGGFITAGAKWLRDYFSNGDQEALIQKLPL